MSHRRIMVLLVALVLVAVVGVMPAGAHVSWCSSDPVVTLADGRVVSVLVEAPVEYAGSTVSVNLLAPQGSVLTAVLPGDLDLDVNFNGNFPFQRMHVVAAPHGGFPVRVTVAVDGATVSFVEGGAGQAMAFWVEF